MVVQREVLWSAVQNGIPAGNRALTVTVQHVLVDVVHDRGCGDAAPKSQRVELVTAEGKCRESPRCAPGTLLNQCRLHETNKHTVTVKKWQQHQNLLEAKDRSVVLPAAASHCVLS